MRKTLIMAFGLVACITAAVAADKTVCVAIAPSDLKWAEVPDTGGVRVATLWGDMHKGPHGAMAQFPAGNMHPLHAHTATLKIVTISGNFLYGPEGGPEKTYAPGSYLMIPGGLKHTSGCTSEAPCVLFQEGSGKFDMKLAGAAKSGKK